ncbi:MAG: sulfite exporter TauE/SafE family protein [Eggerthellaceae bacterium]|jgi:uncharacterized membrane protein YfcA
MEPTLMLVLISLLVGLGIGILSGMLGIGGGSVMLPVFTLGYGLTALQATSTSLFTIIPTAIAGSVAHIRQRTCIIGLAVAAGLGGACFSPLGAYLANISPSWLIILVAAAIILWSAYKMLRKAIAAPKGPASKEELPAAPRTLPHKQLLQGFLIGCAAGFCAGYVGIGGGFLMTPLFMVILGVSMHHASGTSLMAIAILSVPGTVEQILLGNVVVWLGLSIAAGSIPGAVLGARLIKHISERHLRFFFGVLLGVAAVGMIVREMLIG